MSKPKILQALNELDEKGFYNRSTYLGDIRENPDCLESIIENGIYAFTGGEASPTDTTGSYKWILNVVAGSQCTSVSQQAKRIEYDKFNIEYIRYYTDNTWSDWVLTDPVVVFAFNGSTLVDCTYEDIDLAFRVGKVSYLWHTTQNRAIPFGGKSGNDYNFVGLASSGSWIYEYNYTVMPGTTSVAQSSPMKNITERGGTMSGRLVAYSNDNHAIAQVRNIILIPEGEELPAPTSNGTICFPYIPQQ